MSVFRPKYRDKGGKLIESKVYWYEFTYSSKRIRESAKTTRKTIAVEAEKKRKLELERAYAGLPVQAPSTRINTVLDCTKAYRGAYDHGHREKSISWVRERLAHVERLLGNVLLPDLTEARVRSYMRVREQENVSGRTVNMEVSMLARAIGRTWTVLWPKLRRFEERKDTGRALSQEEEAGLVRAAAKSKSPTIVTFVRILLLTAMRCGELSGMTWKQVDFERRVITVGRAKTSSGTGRQIPMNQELFSVMTEHAKWFTNRFGATLPEHYLFPFGTSAPKDPTRPTHSVKKAWNTLRTKAKVSCRLHDLRHTAITKLAESGASDGTIMAIVGHMSRTMLEHYSHIRMNAKRQAMDSLSTPLPKESPKVAELNEDKLPAC